MDDVVRAEDGSVRGDDVLNRRERFELVPADWARLDEALIGMALGIEETFWPLERLLP